jgi:hypothetical protein
MFSNGPLDFFYAAHNQMASTVINITISLTDPFTRRLTSCMAHSWRALAFRSRTTKNAAASKAAKTQAAMAKMNFFIDRS